MEGGKSKGEEVAVTKDVLYIKLMYDSDEFKENLVAVLNNPKLKELEKAETMVKLMPGLKSSVMPKFITFLAKKNRLGGVKRIMLEFVQAMYFNNAITPVKVTSAQRLSDEQKDKIKEKMSSKVGTDIKLLEDVDPGLLGGFKLEWGYQDPDRLIAPSQGVDLSLKFILNKRALQKGVVDAL
ncbi:ATP synthase subunit delta (ATP synthase F(1) sector subunit delta) (F-type ATPase subunit delta) (F-ATPase subunit delta) [Durusdinium trenchii]